MTEQTGGSGAGSAAPDRIERGRLSVARDMSDKIDLDVDPIPAWTFDAEHEKQHAQWAWNTNQESLAWCLDGLISEVERLTIDNRRITEMWDADRETLTAEVERCREVVKTFTLGNAVLEVENVRLRAALEEVASYGHWSNCPAGVRDKYRCRCGYGDVRETLGNAKDGGTLKMVSSSKGTVDQLAQRYIDVCAENEGLRAALRIIAAGPPENLRVERHADWAQGVARTFLPFDRLKMETDLG